MHPPNEEEFKEWLTHPCTQWVRYVLSVKRNNYRHEWEGGSFSQIAATEYMVYNAAAVGECKGLAFVQDMEYESFLQEIENAEERERVETPGQGSINPGVHAGEEKRND